MSATRLSPQLLSDIGVTRWHIKPAFQSAGLIAEQSEPIPPTDQPRKIETMTSNLVNNAPCKWVLFGDDLTAIWQAQGNQAWLLWQSIMNVHLDNEQQMIFFDTALIGDEDQQFEVLEQVIESGVEQVFTMDAEHPINEMLMEGTQVIALPSFEQLLEQPSQKRAVYVALLEAGLVKNTPILL